MEPLENHGLDKDMKKPNAGLENTDETYVEVWPSLPNVAMKCVFTKSSLDGAIHL